LDTGILLLDLLLLSQLLLFFSILLCFEGCSSGEITIQGCLFILVEQSIYTLEELWVGSIKIGHVLLHHKYFIYFVELGIIEGFIDFFIV